MFKQGWFLGSISNPLMPLTHAKSLSDWCLSFCGDFMVASIHLLLSLSLFGYFEFFFPFLTFYFYVLTHHSLTSN